MITITGPPTPWRSTRQRSAARWCRACRAVRSGQHSPPSTGTRQVIIYDILILKFCSCTQEVFCVESTLKYRQVTMVLNFKFVRIQIKFELLQCNNRQQKQYVSSLHLGELTLANIRVHLSCVPRDTCQVLLRCYLPNMYASPQCCGSGSVESVSFPWIRIRIKKWLDPTKTIENIK